ncbi:MAG: alkaline phosphatase D family protein [Chitinophagales bacterium]
MKQILLGIAVLLSSLSFSQSHQGADRAVLDPAYAPFYHGVASGDPLPDRVIIWTRVTTTDPSVIVDWKMATDTAMSNVVASGSTSTDTSKDYTVKVDVSGLLPGNWYYYQFITGGSVSPVGRTRTAPTGDNDSLRLAVVSCSNYQAGYFNVYNHISKRNDIAAVLHLGDYIYEYQAKGYGYAGDSLRRHEPANEILTLADYRMRHSQYKLDPDLRFVHQQYPFICVWDDHESANDSYKDGAQNHTEGVEGLWVNRKSYAEQAYFEWIPIREYHAGDTIHRTLHYGDLADLIMLDTRLEGREHQADSASDPVLADTNRTIMGAHQLEWFKGQLSSSMAKWKIIGNQVMIAPLYFLGNPLNLDQWDGYPEERKKVLNYIKNNDVKNVVFLTGDIHTSWGNDVPIDRLLYDSVTHNNSAAVEFVTTSVTSPGLTNANNSLFPTIVQFNPHVRFAELEKKGYVLLDINKQRTQGDWYSMSTVSNKNYTATVAGSWFCRNNEPWLTRASQPTSPVVNNAPFAPRINTTVGVKELPKELVVVSCFPNPAENTLHLQYYLFQPSEVSITVKDLNGRTAHFWKIKEQSGLLEHQFELDQLSTGAYLIEVKANGNSYVQRFIKR